MCKAQKDKLKMAMRTFSSVVLFVIIGKIISSSFFVHCGCIMLKIDPTVKIIVCLLYNNVRLFIISCMVWALAYIVKLY